MKFITQTKNGTDLGPYLKYLEEVRDKLPANARNFAFYEGHYDMAHKRCLHDSWVESVSIKEMSQGSREEIRQLRIEVKLFNSYHDGWHEIVYKDVKNYSLNLERVTRGSAKIGHGDLYVDEILLNDDNTVSHEIAFSDTDGAWKIISSDIIYRWIPLTPP